MIMDSKKYPCPCCGQLTYEEFEFYEICPECNWEDDPLQKDDPDDAEGANIVSLNQAKALWAKGEKVPY